MPEKRGATVRNADFNEIYAEFAEAKAAEQASRCSNVVFPFVRPIARCTIISLIG